MISLLYNGEIVLFTLIVIALVLSLGFHEFGHAMVAKINGDNTAELAGRLTLNPLAHVDPVGLLMVVLVGFGYAKPVPTNPGNFRSRRADLWVAGAGPAMNLILAIGAWNFFLFMRALGVEYFMQPEPVQFFVLLVQINLVLMIFNLIPLGPLDGNYILPHFLPRRMASTYREYNARYGNYALFGLIILGVLGVPIFSYVLSVGAALIPLITFF